MGTIELQYPSSAHMQLVELEGRVEAMSKIVAANQGMIVSRPRSIHFRNTLLIICL